MCVCVRARARECVCVCVWLCVAVVVCVQKITGVCGDFSGPHSEKKKGREQNGDET